MARKFAVLNIYMRRFMSFGTNRAIVTSANLTETALLRNHEFGFVSTESNTIKACETYFDQLWARAGKDLSQHQVDEWEKEVSSALIHGAFVGVSRQLGDKGVSLDFLPDPILVPTRIVDAEQAFVKFFGKSNNRANRSLSVLDEVRRSGCHWACTYPVGKRPRAVRDGAVMFMGRLVDNPSDIMIYGRALAMQHLPGRDDASPADLELREWKEDFPHYIRVHHAEFMDGTLRNAISLSNLMDNFGFSSFAPTQRNAEANIGRNVNPRRAYLRQPAVELTLSAATWLNEKLELAYAINGKLSPSVLSQLDWPAEARPFR
jgi:hypothetical protein